MTSERNGDLGVAIEIGGGHATSAVVDATSVLRKTTHHVVEPRLATTLTSVATDVRGLLADLGSSARDCNGVSLAFCGIVDQTTGRVLATPEGKFDDARDCDLPAWSKEAFGLPLWLENDARLALLGERAAGAARGYDDVVMITLGTGIGGAAMVDGKLLASRHKQAGVIGGHIPIAVEGRPCSCGGHGCAEAEASTWALPGICADWPGFADSSLAREQTIDYRTLFRHYDAGDRVAAEVLDRSCHVWATLAVTLVHAYDPEIVVLGGAVMRRAEEILPRIRAHVEQRAWTPGRTIPLEQAVLGDDAPLYGAIPLLGLAA